MPISTSLIDSADRIVEGEVCYFSWKWLPKPATWRENPFNGFESPQCHWSKLKDFDAKQGDIKWIWEPSRFDWAVTLARAFVATGDEKYRNRFVELLTDWRTHNRPNEGINWYCGQECSLRMLALIFAATAFADHPDASDLIWSTVAELATRVEPTIGYAIGQHNNHGTSEAMGLYLAGMCLPDHPGAATWRETGKRVLCQLVREQFADDGSYVQHSFVYQRLAMRACLVAFLAGRQFGDTFPADAEGLVLKSAKFLHAMMVSNEPGRLPNYGANDGANALSLSDCEYLDFRPIIQLATGLLTGSRAFDSGPWDEDLAWFGVKDLPDATVLPPQALSYRADAGGYYVLRGEQDSYAFMRVPKYTDGRPGQADALHVDIWFDGEPVAVDSGTYSYNDPDGWYKHFKSTGAHNTIMVDGKDQMPLASRFLYTHWTLAEAPLPKVGDDGMAEFSSGPTTTFADDPAAVLGVSHAYEQIGLGVRHERILQRFGAAIHVTDTLQTTGWHRYCMHWHLIGEWERQDDTLVVRNDGATLQIITEEDATLCLLTDWAPQTMISERYGETTPATLIRIEFEAGACSLSSVFSPPLVTKDYR